MNQKITTTLFPLILFLLFTACGGDDGGGNGKRGTPVPSEARDIAVGDNHACAVLKTGKMVCWGYNASGELGTGNNINSATPVEVDWGEGESVVTLNAGSSHTCALLNDNTIQCWGSNLSGQLGDDGTSAYRNVPVEVDLGEGRTAVGISLGYFHTCALLDDGSLVCWGNNLSGQVGDGNSGNNLRPTPVNLGSGVKARAVSAGRHHTCAILDDGKIVCWGGNGSGELGDGSTTDRLAPVQVNLASQRTATAITSGSKHVCAILDDGSLVCWGENDFGQLGDGTTTNRNAPVAVDTGDKNVVNISAGENHTCALLDDNSVVCWGVNLRGQLGDETIVNKSEPTAVNLGMGVVSAIDGGESSTCALFKDGSVACWGNNQHGQLGTGENDLLLSPQTVEIQDETVTAISGGSGYMCALFEDEDSLAIMKCWGRNNYGQLGSGDEMNRLNPANLSPTLPVTAFSAGASHVCVVTTLTDSKLACWGRNNKGQLGTGNKTNQSSATNVNLGSNIIATAVSAGGLHSCAIVTNDKIKCWGLGSLGQLGNGASNDSSSPVSVTMGGSVTAEKISAGTLHTCAIFNDNKVYCWGENSSGQLGIGSTTAQNTPTVVNLGDSKTATAISAGNNHTCAILGDGSVKCWGSNDSGQVGDRSTTNRTSPVLVPLGSGRTATAIHAKRNHSCAILDDGSLLCWGLNEHGQLGDGTTTNRNTPVSPDLGESRTATKIWGGGSQNCALLDDESLKCWGNNHNGQAGLPTAHRGDQANEMGENLIFVDFGY